MNVTIKLPDELCRQARHRAVDESKSLSAWMADLLRRELEHPGSTNPKVPTLLESLTLKDAPEWYFERELPLNDRKSGAVRDFSFDA